MKERAQSMTADAPRSPYFRHSYKEFSWTFAKVSAVFLFGGALCAYLLDVALSSIAIAFDFLGYPNRVGHAARAMISVYPIMVPLGYVVLLVPNFISTLLALMSFLIIGRVSLWWMVATAPFVVYRAGFSFVSGTYWNDVRMMAPIGSPRFLTLLAIQIAVVAVCWWWVRKLRRPALWHPAATVRSNGR